MTSQHAEEVETGRRFAFGENWSRFLDALSPERVRSAEQALCQMLGIEDLRGKRFLDIGSGSGLSSLAARSLGARVYSFDFDPRSVACTVELKRRYFPDDPDWSVESGSVLDPAYLEGLGQFDVVYSWGVLHHTGQMYKALDNAARSVASDGLLFIAIYNDQGPISRYWTGVKRAYNKGPIARTAMIALHAPYLLGVRWVVRTLAGRGALARGMSLWHDMIDWLGGLPFEVAKPEAVFTYLRRRGFTLEALKTCGGRMGCNEFVFRRQTG